MAVRRPAGHLRRAAGWRSSGDETYWEGLKSEVVPCSTPTRHVPRPQSAIEGVQKDAWMQQLERMQWGHSGGPACDQMGPFYNKNASLPSLSTEQVGSFPQSSHQGLPNMNSGNLSSRGVPIMCDISPAGSQGSLKDELFHNPERRRSWEKASIKQAPGKEQAKLSSLAPVRIGWLPIQRNITVADSPGQNSYLENPISQLKLKQPITPTFLKNPGKENGFRHMDGAEERSQARPNPMSVRTWCLPDQESHTDQQVSDKECRTSAEGNRLLSWQALRRGWTINRTSPISGGTQPNDHYSRTEPESNSKRPLHRTTSGEPCGTTAPTHRAVSLLNPHTLSHTQTPSAGTALVPKSTSFSSITISSRKVTRTSSLPGSSRPSSPGEQPSFHSSSSRPRAPVPSEPLSPDHTTLRQASIVKVAEHRMNPCSPVVLLNGPQGPRTSVSCEPQRGHSCEVVVRRRKATIIKVTEHRESYSAGQGGLGSRQAEYRHSYTEGVYRENSLWQQGSLESPDHNETPFYKHLEHSPESTNSSSSPNRATTVYPREPESGSTLHRSTLCLYVSGSSTNNTSTEKVNRERSVKARRPVSCYAGMFGHSEPSPEMIGTQAPPRKWSVELPGEMHIDSVKDTAIGLDTHAAFGFPISAGTAFSNTGHPVAETATAPQQQQKLQAEVRSQPPPLTLIQAPEPRSQQSPEHIIALNAAAVIANIKLQRQLSKKTTPNGISAKESNSSPLGNILVRGVATCENQRTNHNMVQQDPGVAPIPSRLDTPINSPAKALSLREALELSRPDFISRSQGRLRELGRRAQERRELQDSSDPQPENALRQKRGHCTRSNPQSDNLFRPRDRAITGKEMHLRSKRNYNNLPEVRRKKEEENRRVISQTNRQRVELFKKKLLDQILQRGND
ncbi:(E2-independent) E3 ubiquitin-conjugating enzyme FATS isoform X2 [Osmerus eperlanus]|uniref:(E2-independent) E3 ubiquitin-conjugating enzyme FATS isoform X2 n=1 Tax=Osmerus eperlanus TaxID=29151 RepID=UPI002E0FB169